MKKHIPKRPWGFGRVVFMARLEEIRADLAQGVSLMAIYEKHQEVLSITYSSFRKLAKRYAQDARPAPSPRLPPKRTQAPANQLQLKELTPDVRDNRSRASGFRHTGVTKPGEIEALLGPDYLKGRRRS